jgi:hypothetical protein
MIQEVQKLNTIEDPNTYDQKAWPMRISQPTLHNSSVLWWLVPITGLLLFWTLNLVMPLSVDDFGCSVFSEAGKPKLIKSLSQLMQSVQGNLLSYDARLGILYYRFSLIFLPRQINTFVLTLWVGSLVFLLLRLALRRKIRATGFDMTLWLGILILLFLPIQRVENFISTTAGLSNYIPGGVGTLIVLDKISRWFIEGESDAPKWWLYVVGFASGWSNEVFGFFMVPFFALIVLWHTGAEKKPLGSVPRWVWYLTFSFMIGLSVIVFAPATLARSLGQPTYSGLPSALLPAMLYVRYGLLSAPLNIGIVFMLLLFARKEDSPPLRERIFFVLLLISTAGIIFPALYAGFIPYGRALWGVYLVLGIILVWGASHLLKWRTWLVTFPVMVGALFFFGALIWNTYVVRMSFKHLEQAFVEAGNRGDNVLLVDYPALRKEPHATIMRDINRVVLVQRDPKHWFNTDLVRYYTALHADKEGFEGPSYIMLDNLVPPYLSRYAFDTKDDPLNRYPEIQSLIQRQKTRYEEDAR